MQKGLTIFALSLLIASWTISRSIADETNDELRAREEAHERNRREAKLHPDQDTQLTNAELSDQLRNFIIGFLDAANRNDPVTQEHFYAPTVGYMDYGTVSRAFVLEDIRKYNAKWPSHKFVMQNWYGVTGDDQHGITVHYSIQFTVQRPDRALTGTADEHLKISTIDGVRSISTHRETVTSRH
jgi:hypothetical protein